MVQSGDNRPVTVPDGDGPTRRAGHRRLPGVDLRPGAVKQARVEAGLSLAKVGKGCVTAPAAYLIETGRTRPSLPTLEHIARRLGKSVAFFLADQGGATDDTRTGPMELVAMVAEGRHQEAMAHGAERLTLSTSAHRRGQLRSRLARPLLATGHCRRTRSRRSRVRTVAISGPLTGTWPPVSQGFNLSGWPRQIQIASNPKLPATRSWSST